MQPHKPEELANLSVEIARIGLFPLCVKIGNFMQPESEISRESARLKVAEGKDPLTHIIHRPRG
jgi:hypothetical protein